MDFIIAILIGAAVGALLGFAVGFVFPAARHGALRCFLACVGLFWLYCSFAGGSLFDGSLATLCYGVFMRLFYGAFVGCLAPPAYCFARFLAARTRKPRPPA